MSTITMTNTDPGEGSPLAADNFVAVYDGISLLDLFYPIGTYYETSDTSFDPNVSWGGVWVEDTAGRMTVAQKTSDSSFDVVGETGGSKTHQHRLPILVNHASNWECFSWNWNPNYGTETVTSPNTNNFSHTATASPFTGQQLKSETISNMSPYIVVKRWHRTA